MGVDTDINQSFKVSLQTEVGKMKPLSQSHDENQWHHIVLHSKTGYLIRTRRACPSFEARGIFLEPEIILQAISFSPGIKHCRKDARKSIKSCHCET